MNYREVLELFAESEIGAIVVAKNNIILDINSAAGGLLSLDGSVRGQWLEKIAPFLCRMDADAYQEVAFNRYVKAGKELTFPELPPEARVLTFQDATQEVQLELVKNVLNHVSEAITIWDKDGRMLMLNDAAVKLEGHTEQEVIGKYSAELFQTRNNSILVIPHMLRNKEPVLKLRQDYVTETGKELQIVSDNYLITKSSHVLGAVSIMEDYTKVDELNRQIIELQRKLMNQSKTPSAAKEEKGS